MRALLPFAPEAASLAFSIRLSIQNPMSSPSAAAFRSRLALDLRGLALFRAGLGAVLLVDALMRLCSSALLYADSGLLPRSVATGVIESARISLHLANGSALFALGLTLLQALAAAALLLGWRTRVASLLCWVLAVSAAARHPAIVGAGDALALALLSWGLFLPLAARWSLDAANSRLDDEDPAHFSWAGVVMLGQTLCVFLFPALAQPGSVGLGALPLFDALRPTVDLALWWMLLIAPLLLFSFVLAPGRTILIARRAALFLALLLCALTIIAGDGGSLPWLGLCATALWIDRDLWARLGSQDAREGLRIFHAEGEPRTRHLALGLREMLCLPQTSVAPAADSPRAARLMQPGKMLVVFDRDDTAHLDGAALQVLLRRSPLLRPLRGLLGSASMLGVCETLLSRGLRCMPLSQGGTRSLAPSLGQGRGRTLLVLTLGIWAAVAQLTPRGDAVGTWVDALRIPLMPLGLDYNWIRRTPTTGAGWIAVPGELRDGREVDARTSALKEPEFGPAQAPLIAGWRGRLYEQRLLAPNANAARLALAQHLCSAAGESLARLRVVQMLPSRESSGAPAEQRVLLRHECR